MALSRIDWPAWMAAVNNGKRGTPIPLIAEGGINHNGDVATACALVEMASRCGAHIVKFQKRDPEVCVPPDVRDRPRNTPWGDLTYIEYKKRIELDINAYRMIDERAQECGIDWFVSSWDVPSQKTMRVFNSPVNKVASAMLTHLELLNTIAEEGKPTFVSTGMSTLEEIDRAVEIFVTHDCPFILMHTVATYPAKDHDLNLRMIQTLRDRYDVAVGYSGHETTVSPTIVAAALGAVAVERHITLDRASWGTDQAASLEESGLRGLATILRRLPIMEGDGIKRILDGELAVAKHLRYWR